MSLRKSSPKGKLHKIECPLCGNHSRKTEAQLRENGPDDCRPCGRLHGYPVEMICPDEAVAAITPEGRARALEEALAVAGQRLENQHQRAAAAAYPQMKCEKCKHPLTKALSVRLIDAYQRITGKGYDGGLLWLTVEDGAMPDEGYIMCGREGCTHDRFIPVMPSGRRKRQEKREEEAWAF